MKKILLLPVLLLLAITSFAKSNDAALFSSDETEFATAFTELTAIENYVDANPGISVDEISAPLNINANLLNSLSISGGNTALGIPSFLWGCVFGVAGVAVVYFVTDDRDETKKALWGCVASTVVGVVLYVALVASVASTASTVSYGY